MRFVIPACITMHWVQGNKHIPRVLRPLAKAQTTARVPRSPGNEGLLCSSQHPQPTATIRLTFLMPLLGTSNTHLVRRRGPRSQLSIGRGVKSRCKISHKFWFHGQKSRGTCGIKLQPRAATLHKSPNWAFVCLSEANLESREITLVMSES